MDVKCIWYFDRRIKNGIMELKIFRSNEKFDGDLSKENELNKNIMFILI